MGFELDADKPRVILPQDAAGLRTAASEIVLRPSARELASMLPQFSPAMQEAVRFFWRRTGKWPVSR